MVVSSDRAERSIVQDERVILQFLTLSMSLSRLKAGYFFLTAAASVATAYYFNYLFFFLRDRYGFTNRGNLAMARHRLTAIEKDLVL